MMLLPEDKQPRTLVFKYFLLLFAISILLLARLLWPFLAILVLSYLLTGIFQPACKFLQRWISPPFASLLTCILIIVLVFLPLFFFVAALSQEAFELYQMGKSANLGVLLRDLLQENVLVARLQDALASLGLTLEPESFSRNLSEITKVVGLFLYNQASAWATNIAQFVINFVLMIIIIYFLLIDHEQLIDFLLRLSPLPDDQERRLIKKFEEIAWAILIGNGVSGLVQGILGGMAFAFFNLGSPVLWGGMMGVLAFLPIFGIGLVLVPAAFVLLLKGKVVSFAAMLIFYMVLTFCIEYIIKPKMIGGHLKMHTLLVFLSIIGGLKAFGVMGIIYGPLIVTAFLTLADIYLTTYDGYVKNSS